MGCAVVFYSKDRNTRLAAEELAKQKDAKLFELKEKRGKIKGFFGFMRCGFGAVTKKKSVLVNDFCKETEDFSTVYIGSPVWAGNSTPAVNTYVSHAGFAGKKVYLFFTCASQESDYLLQGAVSHLSGVVKQKGGELMQIYVFKGEGPGKRVSREMMAEQVKKALLI